MVRIRLEGEISRNGKSLKESIAPASNCDSGRKVSEERGPSSYFPAAESESDSCVSNRTNPDFFPSITSVFPATSSETDCRSVFHGTPPKYPQSNSIVLSFPAAKSQTYSSENDEIFQNPSQATATHPYTMSVSYNGPTTDLFFPPNMSETETGSSESNETPQPFSNSIILCFPPARSQTNSSKNDEIIQNPSIASFCDGYAYVFHSFLRSLSMLRLSSESNFESDLPSPSESRILSTDLSYVPRSQSELLHTLTRGRLLAQELVQLLREQEEFGAVLSKKEEEREALVMSLLKNYLKALELLDSSGGVSIHLGLGQMDSG